MASGSRGRGQGSAVAGADALNTLTNPDLALLPAVDLVVHLHRDGRSGSDFADVAPVLAVRERRLAEAEARIREADVDAAGLRDRIRTLELRVANAEALARDHMVAGEDDKSHSQAGDHLTASDIGAAELTCGEIRARNLEIVVPEPGAGEITPGVCFEAGAEVGDNIPSPIPLMRIDAFPVPVTAAPALPDELIEERAVDDESQAGDHLTASDIGEAELTGGEIRARNLEIVVPEPGAGEITPGMCFEACAEVGDNIPSPIPLMRIDAFPVPVTAAPALPDELIEERAVERVVVDVAVPRSHEVVEAGVVDCRDKISEAIARKRKKKPASDLPPPLDDLRGHEVTEAGVVDCQYKVSEAIAPKRKKPASDLPLPLEDHRVTGHKVSEEEVHGEDVAASPHRRSQLKQPARSATKKAPRQKETSFYNEVYKALVAKQNLLKKKEKEASAKKAAAAASKQLHCTCWWSDAPYSS